MRSPFRADRPDRSPQPPRSAVRLTAGAAAGAIFTAIDGQGAGNELEPQELEVTLKKAVGTPRVDIIVVDAGRSGDIKWIRVRRD